MNIGFEAKRAYTNNTGLGHYCRTLIRSLAEFHRENSYTVFSPKLTDRFDISAYRNINAVTPSHFPSSLFKGAWRSSWVKKDIKDMGIDIFHGLSHEIPIGMQKTGIRSAVTIHDLIFERYPEQFKAIDVKIYRYKFSYACRNADKVIAISKQTKEDIVNIYNIPEEKIVICYQSCNPAFAAIISEEERIRIKKLYQLPDQFLLYVGSIIERKNLLLICKALEQLTPKFNLPLVVIGDGTTYKKEVQHYIHENKLESQVRFLSDEPEISKLKSYQSATDFPAIYQQATCLIYPSIFEGFGIPILEALWSRVPVITSNVSCLPETGGDAAFYVNPYNVDEMVHAILQVSENEALRKSMVEKGWHHAQQFTPRKCAEEVMNVYTSLHK
jgi:glycosyltransferase involved in cell wall biosynthesis